MVTLIQKEWMSILIKAKNVSTDFKRLFHNDKGVN
jgi:hypothetical protein